MKILNVTPDEFERVLAGKGELTLDQLIERSVMIRMTASGMNITPDEALRAPTVFAIVNALSRILASLPFGIIRDQTSDGNRSHVLQKNHPVTTLLNVRPNKWMTRYEYWALVTTRLLLWGNFYALKTRNSDQRVIALEPIPPELVTVEQDRRMRLQFRWQTKAGGERVVGQDRMHFIRTGVSTDGLVGISPIARIKESIAMEIQAEKFGGTVFGNGAIPNIILTRKSSFKDTEARDRFKRGWDKVFSRSKRGTAVLEGDEWEVNTVQMSNEDSQFLETRELQRSIIAGAFGVPPHIVGDLKRATFSNISNQTLELLMFTLAPLLECIERATERDFLTTQEVDRGLFSQFDTKRLLRGDPKTMSDLIAKLRQWGILSANEGRAMMEMDAREDEGGDEYLTPLNFQASDDEEEDESADSTVPPVRAVE